MVSVPANTPRFGFSPCKKNLLFLVSAKCFVFKKQSLQGLFPKTKYFARTFLKIKIFCRAIFLQNGFSHHVSCVQIITKVGSGTKTKMRHICREQKQQKKVTETKTKTRHICRDQNIFQPLNNANMFTQSNTSATNVRIFFLIFCELSWFWFY